MGKQIHGIKYNIVCLYEIHATRPAHAVPNTYLTRKLVFAMQVSLQYAVCVDSGKFAAAASDFCCFCCVQKPNPGEE